MPLTLVTPPNSAPVSIEEARQRLRIDTNASDADLELMIKAAAGKLDGPAGTLGRCLVAQTWLLSLDSFSGKIVLPLPPCVSVDRVSYLDQAGEEVEIAAGDYRVTGIGTLEGACIRPARGKSWPVTCEPDTVFIRFTAGFGASPEDVPEPLRAAIMLHVGHMDANRESVTLANGFISETPHGYADLIRDYRIMIF